MFRRQSFNVAVREEFMFRPFMLAGALLALNLHPAAAQQPTQAQRDAIRASCRSDFMANCASVTPGGKEALECLLRNQAKLSPACNTAVSAIAAPESPPKPPAPAAAAPAPSAPPPAAAEQAAPKPAAASPAEPAPKASAATQEAQLKTVRQSCTLNDFMAHCSWIKPSNPELLLCLQSNASDLSPACQTAVQELPPAAAQAPERRPAAAAPSKKSSAAPEPATPPPAPPAAAAAPARPSDDQKAAIRAACRSDFMANCSGVQPSGAAALQCLQSNSAKLSASCQSAVAAIGSGGAPAASTSAAPAASAPTPAVAPLGPIPPMLPREALGILAMCRAEQQTICGGIPLGGGRVLSCLADHEPQLSLQCYEALARATR
jgi:hypothetical protein